VTLSTLLVANRGEIALRVMRTARARGLRTVAVYSDADRDAPHVRAADAAVRIGPAPAADSYLRIDALLDAAARTGADAVHPGYGFLSERAALARAVVDAGLVWVGPPPEVVDLMGRKDAARAAAVAAGVPVVPAVDVEGPRAVDPAVFPLLVKAAAGGGGKGMRIVRDPGDLPAALTAAGREARAAFGDGTLLVERYLPTGRHVEVQVLADRHGHVLHLGERDCSAQRRHQKVIEEAPAPGLSADLRGRLAAWAVALAKQVGYVNAGTVEFLVTGRDDRAEAFFLEMNTRLQVEHPVTEAVTGLDLVALQLAVVVGEPLPLSQADVRMTGHAMEARVYAEDAFAGFLPQAGTAEVVRWPARARVDAALEPGQVVGTEYDPMLGKIVVHGPTREAARRALVDALDGTAVIGLTTNAGFLRALAASHAFRDGEVHTAWLDAHGGTLAPPDPWPAAAIAAVARSRDAARDAAGAGHPFAVADGWRLGGAAAPVRVDLAVAGEAVTFHVERDGRVVAGERSWDVRVDAADDEGVGGPGIGQGRVVRAEVDGVAVEAVVRLGPSGIDVAFRGHTHCFGVPDAFGPGPGHVHSDGTVVAPMPGTVTSVQVRGGDRVAAGAVLGVLEAMKMEVPLRAPVGGTVTGAEVAAGDRVALGAVLFTVAEEA
jgi:3-methylcrotonyl-CoA carboxylase alpha subunit/acetyl-CoA/propionyl-CoA carboxylase biotin carboxyl carrier protein